MPETPPAAVPSSPPASLSGGGGAVRPVDPLADPSWDAGLAGRADASIFHGAAWARVLRETYGFAPFYLTERDPSGRASLLPLLEANSWLTGRRGVSLPFTDECAPLCADDAACGRLFRAARELARARGWRYLEFRGGRARFGDVPASTSYFGHRLALRRDEAGLFAAVESSTRRAVRKAEQGGLTVEVSASPAAMEAFYRLLCRTRRRHGLPAQPFRFFRNLQRDLLAPGLGSIYLVRAAGVPVAGAVFFHFGATVLYKFGASDDRQQHLRPNNLLMWRAIADFAARGFATLDFGRTSLGNDGLRRFKLGWGAEERRIDYVRYDCRADCWVTAPDSAAGWHNRIFRLLPVPLSRMAGAILYKHVA